jgi:hypothetical protein
MRKLSIALLLLLAISCSKDQVAPGKGSATFSMSQVSRGLKGGRMASAITPSFVLLSIEDNSGNSIFKNKKLSLFSFGQGYESESLELTEGAYKLTQFQILNANDTIIYASPLAGSSLAQYVTYPLPLSFTVTKGTSIEVVPQVLAVTSTDAPNNFGYASFGFELVSIPTIQFSLPNSNLIDKVTFQFESGSEKKAIEFLNPKSILTYTSDSLLGKIWDASIVVWLKKDSCFQRVKRYTGKLDLTLSNSLSLPSIKDASWKDYFYSEIVCGNDKISIYRSVNYKNLNIELDIPSSVQLYWGYADQGYWDKNWDLVSSMSIAELSTGNKTQIIKVPYICNNGVNPFFVDNLLVFDISGCGHVEDYFVWSGDGKPYCQTKTGAAGLRKNVLNKP